MPDCILANGHTLVVTCEGNNRIGMVQTTVVPSAGATIVEFKVDIPGDYLLVDHSIFRVAKGAVGFLSVTGRGNPEIFNSIQRP